MADGAEHIKIVVIQGSVRPGNYTAMAAALVVDELRKIGVQVKRVDPAEYRLPFPGVDPNAEGTRRLQAEVGEATGVVLATPEYHGSLSSVMKLVIENLGFPSVLAGKPMGLLGVAAGAIGAIKSLEQLRGICSHVGAMVLPLSVSVANCQKVFDAQGKCLDANLEKLIRGVGTNVVDYIRQTVCPRMTLERLLREGAAAVATE